MTTSVASLRASPCSLYSDPSTPRSGRVLSRAEAIAVAERLLAFCQDKAYGVYLTHTSRAVTTITASGIRRWAVGDELALWFPSLVGDGWPLYVQSNQLDDASLKRVVARAFAMRPPDSGEPEDMDDPSRFTFNRREFLPVSLWHDTTARALDMPATELLTELWAPVERAGLQGTGSLVVSARSVLYTYRAGLTAWAQDTDSELTLTVRTSDGSQVGWAGEASRDVSKLRPKKVGETAVAFAQRGPAPKALEPGRRTVILTSEAVAQLLRFMPDYFDANQTNDGRTPFSAPFSTEPGAPRNYVGKRVIDRRLRLVSDPADPLGGFPPFYELGASSSKPIGLPVPAMTWIEEGVLKNLAYTLDNAGRQWCELPYSVRLEPMPGTATSSLDEMIAACEEGIFITRFGNINVVDTKTGQLSGVTSNGCFLIKHGRINQPIKNFSFSEAPLLAFNRIRMVGPATRAALGQEASTMQDIWGSIDSSSRWSRYPRSPIIAPPLMIDDFALTALADTV